LGLFSMSAFLDIAALTISGIGAVLSFFLGRHGL
jgi:hypothetical protein